MKLEWPITEFGDDVDFRKLRNLDNKNDDGIKTNI